MKIFFAIKRLNNAVGGAERVLCAICTVLARKGYEVSILSFDNSEGEPFYFLDQRVHRIYLNVGDVQRPSSFLETFIRIKKIREIIKKQKPDIVVGFMHSMFIPLTFALLGMRICIIGSEHTVPAYYKKKPFQFLLFMISAYFLKKITVLSENIKNSYPLPIRSRMVEILNPVEKAQQCIEYTEKEYYTILSVGRLEESKDHQSLIQAFALIARDFPNWNLSIVGEGPEQKRIQDLILKNNLQSQVSLFGFTRNIEEKYLSSDIFVLPSRYEAFGLVTVEAMMHGLPVIGFADCPGTNSLIENQKNGLLINVEDDRVQALANGMRYLINDPVYRKTLGKNAQAWAQDRFSIDKIVNQWENLFNSLLNK